MYPRDAEKSLQLDIFVTWRVVAALVMAATGAFVIWLLYQLAYEGTPPDLNQTLVLMALVALTFGAVYLALSAIKPDHLYQQYNTKAGFEELLYKMLQQIEADKALSKEQRGALYRRYVEIMKDTTGREQHLSNLPRGPITDSLREIVTQMRQEEGRRVLQGIQENDGCPASELMRVSHYYCQRLENILGAIPPAQRAS